MLEISGRLLLRIEADFPHHTDAVLERLHAMAGLISASRQDHERLLAAVLRCAGGRLDRLEAALALAYTDWRDLLVAADLAGPDWPVALSAWLSPSTVISSPSPVVRGELVESDGRRWVLRRRRLDLRLVKRLLHRPDAVVVVAGPGRPVRRLAATERAAAWLRAQRSYAGPGAAGHPVDGPVFLGHEFADEAGVPMLFLEELR